jgi:aminopeptidase N
MMIVQMLKGGLEKKMKLLRETPESYSLNRQVELLNKAIQNYSN